LSATTELPVIIIIIIIMITLFIHATEQPAAMQANTVHKIQRTRCSTIMTHRLAPFLSYYTSTITNAGIL